MQLSPFLVPSDLTSQDPKEADVPSRYRSWGVGRRTLRSLGAGGQGVGSRILIGFWARSSGDRGSGSRAGDPNPWSGIGVWGLGPGIGDGCPRLRPGGGRLSPALPRWAGSLTVHGRSGRGSPRRNRLTGTPGPSRSHQTAPSRGNFRGHRPLPATGRSRETTTQVPRAGRCRCRGDPRRSAGLASVSHSRGAPAEVRSAGLRRGAVGSPMGLSKSKHKPRKGKGPSARRLIGPAAAVRAGLAGLQGRSAGSAHAGGWGCWAPHPPPLLTPE